MSVKSLNNSLSYFHFIEASFEVNDYIFTTAAREAIASDKDADKYKFMLTLLTKKYPFTKSTYVLLKATLDAMIQNKMFNTLINMHGLVVNGVVRKLIKDPGLIDLGIDVIAFFVIGFQVHANYFIDE